MKAKPSPAAGAWSYLTVVCATLAAYLPALGGGLLWDDSSHVTRPDLQSWHGLWRIWFQVGATQQYYPLLHSAFWFEHRLWGGAVLGYHLTNVALHAASACLVLAIARRLGLRGAWIAGMLFALHPIAVEAVAWISEQKSALSGFFYLAAALVYLTFDEDRRIWRYGAALALFLLALASKTVTATLPAALLVVLWWRHGRLAARRDVLPLIPWLAAGAAAGWFTAWVEKTLVGANGADFALAPLDRLLLAGRVIWFYAAKMVWPANLTFFYPRWKIDAGVWWQYLFPVGVLAAALGLWLLARRMRGPLAAGLIFGGTLFPVLGFFNVYPFRYSYVADHFAYLAGLGILLPAAWALAGIAPRAARIAAVTAVLGALALLTWRQCGLYRDEETLYRATIARNPASWLAETNLGNLLLKRGARDDAMRLFAAALAANPDFWEAHLSRGNALLDQPGRLPDAIAEYRIAASLAPASERTHTNLGNALVQQGRTDEAIGELRTALRLQPSDAEAHNDLGNALARLPDGAPQAMAEYQAALRYDPQLAEAHNNLGRLTAQIPGGLPAAIAEFQEAIRIRPDYFGAHDNLGNALSAVPGRREEAIAEYRAALAIRPDFAPAHNNLGFALSQMDGRLEEAAAEYRRAIALAPDFAQAHYNLANALARMGRRAEALAEYETGLRLAPNPQARQIVERLRVGK